MGPFTINTLSRESSPKTVKTVPKVATSNVSKKPTSASAKKHVTSKLGELGLKSMSSTASTTASNEAGSPDVIDIDTYDSIPMYSQISIDPLSPIMESSLPTLTLYFGTPSTFDPFPSSFDSSLNIAIPEWALQFQRQFREHELRFEKQDHRFHHLESLIQENSELKQTVARQARLIAELNARLLAVPEPDLVDDSMQVDTPRDLSSNGSKWKNAPPTTSTTVATPPAVINKTPTMAQVVAAASRKQAPKKKSLAKKVVTATANCSGQLAVHLIQISVHLVSNLCTLVAPARLPVLIQCGIDNSRILDINFPAHGVIGVLLHVQYADTFTGIIKKIGAELISEFDHYGGLVVLKSTLCPIQEIVFTGSLPETDEFSVESAPVESAPVESAPVVRLIRRRANN
ncbi:hypothetical protein MFLAVUS_011490 [Mucor flavus]|uniref:Uncharacterized protein n=1 Tax=Mucor flavus TaxID=439312 RepID=A0ABP9ZFM2_9FUNG